MVRSALFARPLRAPLGRGSLSRSAKARQWRSPAGLTLAGVLTISEAGVQAQELADPEPEIIVTATKRQEPLSRVPASISALGAAELESRDIHSIEALSHNMPNVAYMTAGGIVPNFSIRGVSADGASPVMEGTAALHVDGVYLPRANMLELAMADLQSAEILRGPQGTLYGRNANAGVISLTTKRPTPEFAASLAVSTGSFKRYAIRGWISGPLTPSLSYRLFAMFDRSDGYGRNLLLDTKVDGHERVGGRASFRWEPAAELTVDLIGSYARNLASQPFYIGNAFGRQPGSNYNRLVDSGADGRFSLRPYEVYNNFDPKQSARHYAATAIVDWRLRPNVSLKSITGYQAYRYRSIQDHDGTPTEWIVALGSARSTTFSQELNLTATAGPLNFVGGLYYLDDDLDGGFINEIPPGNPFGNAAAPNLLLNVRLSQRSTSLAAYADVTYAISARVRLLAGLRRTRDRRETVQRIEAAINASFSNPGTPITGCSLDHPVPDIGFSSTMGKLGVQFDILPTATAYASFQNGFKAGGYSSTICDNQFLPEKLSSLEAGFKGRFFDDALKVNIAAFHYEYKNMQLLRTFNPTPSTISAIVDNASSARLWGGELEAAATLGRAWQTDLAIGFVHSEYGPLEARNGAAPDNPNVVLTGKRLPRAPKWTIIGGLEYRTDIAGFGALKLRAQYSYVSKIYYSPFSEPIARQRGYGLLDLSAMLEPKGSNLVIRIFGRNLTGEAYFTGLFTSAISNNGRGPYGEPRSFGIEVAAGF